MNRRYTMRYYDHHNKVVMTVKADESGAAMISADYYMGMAEIGEAFTYIQRCALFYRNKVVARKHINGVWIEWRWGKWSPIAVA